MRKQISRQIKLVKITEKEDTKAKGYQVFKFVQNILFVLQNITQTRHKANKTNKTIVSISKESTISMC